MSALPAGTNTKLSPTSHSSHRARRATMSKHHYLKKLSKTHLQKCILWQLTPLQSKKPFAGMLYHPFYLTIPHSNSSLTNSLDLYHLYHYLKVQYIYIYNSTMSAEAALTTTAARSIAPHLFPARVPPTKAQIDAGIEKVLEVQRRAVTFGKRPFAAVLLGPDNETVLLMHQSIDQVNHAESSLARLAYSHYSKEFLWTCTLVSTWEPCAMCSCEFLLGFFCCCLCLRWLVELGWDGLRWDIG